MRYFRPQTVLCRPSRRCYNASENLIQIRSGTFYRKHPSSVPSSILNPSLFPYLTFSLPATSKDNVGKDVRKSAHWAVIGSGDTTTFLEVLRGGHLCIPPQARTYPYLSFDEIGAEDQRNRVPSNAIQYVGFNAGNKAALGGGAGTQGAYLSARYESRREETDWSVLKYLKGETELNPSVELTRTVKDTNLLDRVIRDLRLGKLLDMPVSTLSNGQTRRCRIAKALLSEPKCLLLDDPFMGLDPPTLRSLSPMLRGLAYRSDPLLVLGLRPQDPVPDWITDLVVLGKNHGVGLMGSRSEVMDTLGRWGKQWQQDRHEAKSNTAMSDEHRELYEKFGKPLDGFGDILTEKGIVSSDPQTPTSQPPPPSPPTRSSPQSNPSPSPQPLIELNSITLSYGAKVILGHATPSDPQGGLTLAINRSTRLALLGPNGSGKTTLLSLLTSDHPQSYSLPIKFFGRERLPSPGIPGLSLWEIQSRIGHSAPEIHSFFPKTHSIRRTLESAWAETYNSKPKLTPERSALVNRFLTHWAPELRQTEHAADDLSWADDQRTHCFRVLPFATQRLLLLLRALVKTPDIVILDEAFSGLDAATRDKAMRFLEVGEDTVGIPGCPFPGLTPDQALVVVSHVRNEVPSCVNEWLRLPSEEEAVEMGKGVKRGRVEDVGGGRGLRSKEGWNEVWGL